jgi:hypothetical protein
MGTKIDSLASTAPAALAIGDEVHKISMPQDDDGGKAQDASDESEDEATVDEATVEEATVEATSAPPPVKIERRTLGLPRGLPSRDSGGAKARERERESDDSMDESDDELLEEYVDSDEDDDALLAAQAMPLKKPTPKQV